MRAVPSRGDAGQTVGVAARRNVFPAQLEHLQGKAPGLGERPAAALRRHGPAAVAGGDLGHDVPRDTRPRWHRLGDGAGLPVQRHDRRGSHRRSRRASRVLRLADGRTRDTRAEEHAGEPFPDRRLRRTAHGCQSARPPKRAHTSPETTRTQCARASPSNSTSCCTGTSNGNRIARRLATSRASRSRPLACSATAYT